MSTAVEDLRSRDYITIEDIDYALAELESDVDGAKADVFELEEIIGDSTTEQEPELNDELSCKEDELEEIEKDLAEVRDFYDQFEGLSEGISEHHFEDYAIDLAESACGIEDSNTWPCNHIDWGSAIDELLMDYTEIEFNGVTYYCR